MNPDTRDYTFCSTKGHAARLDRAYVSSGLLNCVTDIDHPPNAFSDHSFLRVDLDFQEVEYGAKSWNLPTRLLRDEAYLEGVKILLSLIHI